jgi:D-alanyl-D-alanine carboxypeptidase
MMRPDASGFGRALLRKLAPLAIVLGLCTTAQAAAPYVLADVATGRVLDSRDATMPWYPASVTKLMTAYVALRQLSAGRIGWETPIPISRRAAMAAPSKIGAKPGTEVTLENALKMMLVKSANDMAVVVAEGVGGSVETFAGMMNSEAERLGMRESHFINPNGLWVEGQQTSARDMALLARALLTEFPEYSGLFSIGALQLGERILKNTNGLVGRYPGIEGMKTGFICASGFNLVAVASRGNQRLIAVVFGATSNADRTIRAANLLDKGFSSSGFSLFGSGASGSLNTLPPSAVTAAPNMREEICMRRKGPPPSEEEALAIPAASGSDDPRFPFSSAAAMPNTVRGTGRRLLGPRDEFAPLLVTLGRTTGSATAPLAANAVGAPATAVAVAPGGKPPATAFTGDATASEGLPGAVTATAPGTLPLAAAARGTNPAPASANPWMKPATAAVSATAARTTAKAAPAKAAPAKTAAAAAPAKTGQQTAAKAPVKPAPKAVAKPAQKPASKPTAKKTAPASGQAKVPTAALQ